MGTLQTSAILFDTSGILESAVPGDEAPIHPPLEIEIPAPDSITVSHGDVVEVILVPAPDLVYPGVGPLWL